MYLGGKQEVIATEVWIVQSLSRVWLFVTPMDCSMPGFHVHHQLPELALTQFPLSRWCHPTFLSSVIPFSSCFQTFPTSVPFLMSWLFASGGQSIGASVWVLPMNIQDWFPLGLTGLISLQSKVLCRVFSNTTVEKHQFSGTQPSLWSNSHIDTRLLGKPIALTRWTFVAK